MELRIENLKDRDGTPLIQKINRGLAQMHEDILARPDLKRPRRKLTLNLGMFENEEEQISLQEDFVLNLPGPQVRSRSIVAVNIVKDKKQLKFDFSKDPEVDEDEEQQPRKAATR